MDGHFEGKRGEQTCGQEDLRELNMKLQLAAGWPHGEGEGLHMDTAFTESEKEEGILIYI